MFNDPNKLNQLLCPLCGSNQLEIFYSVEEVPSSCNRLWSNKQDAINCTKGSLKLAFCSTCTYVSNIAIEPSKNQYDNQYDNSLFYSPHFQEFADSLLKKMITHFDLYQKNIVEIGGGKVDFLSSMVSLGNNRALRFNPFQQDKSKRYNSQSFPFLDQGKQIDFVFSYHELEHMNNPRAFLDNLKLVLTNNSSVKLFFAVPNSIKDFTQGEYSDIIYEHVSYFTVQALLHLFSSSGFKILSVEETENEIFDSIYLYATIETKKSAELEPPAISASEIKSIRDLVGEFGSKTNENINQVSTGLKKLLDEGKRIVAWGAGARGVTFLNVFRDSRITYVVDINPHKQNMYIPGTGQKIVAPDFLKNYKPDYIILANPSYQQEIANMVANLGLNPSFIPI